MAFLFIMENEIWKDIPNYEGLYQVSNLGNVKNKQKILKGGLGTHGYYYIPLSKNGKVKNYLKHQLVAICFLNHIPCKFKLVVNHKDFNKLNNNVDNLELITNRENCNFKHIKTSSNYVGVNWHKKSNKWEARISINRKRVCLGLFINEIDAHIAYENKLKEIL